MSEGVLVAPKNVLAAEALPKSVEKGGGLASPESIFPRLQGAVVKKVIQVREKLDVLHRQDKDVPLDAEKAELEQLVGQLGIVTEAGGQLMADQNPASSTDSQQDTAAVPRGSRTQDVVRKIGPGVGVLALGLGAKHLPYSLDDAMQILRFGTAVLRGGMEGRAEQRVTAVAEKVFKQDSESMTKGKRKALEVADVAAGILQRAVPVGVMDAGSDAAGIGDSVESGNDVVAMAASALGSRKNSEAPVQKVVVPTPDRENRPPVSRKIRINPARILK